MSRLFICGVMLVASTLFGGITTGNHQKTDPLVLIVLDPEKALEWRELLTDPRLILYDVITTTKIPRRADGMPMALPLRSDASQPQSVWWLLYSGRVVAQGRHVPKADGVCAIIETYGVNPALKQLEQIENQYPSNINVKIRKLNFYAKKIALFDDKERCRLLLDQFLRSLESIIALPRWHDFGQQIHLALGQVGYMYDSGNSKRQINQLHNQVMAIDVEELIIKGLMPVLLKTSRLTGRDRDLLQKLEEVCESDARDSWQAAKLITYASSSLERMPPSMRLRLFEFLWIKASTVDHKRILATRPEGVTAEIFEKVAMPLAEEYIKQNKYSEFLNMVTTMDKRWITTDSVALLKLALDKHNAGIHVTLPDLTKTSDNKIAELDTRYYSIVADLNCGIELDAVCERLAAEGIFAGVERVKMGDHNSSMTVIAPDGSRVCMISLDKNSLVDEIAKTIAGNIRITHVGAARNELSVSRNPYRSLKRMLGTLLEQRSRIRVRDRQTAETIISIDREMSNIALRLVRYCLGNDHLDDEFIRCVGGFLMNHAVSSNDNLGLEYVSLLKIIESEIASNPRNGDLWRIYYILAGSVDQSWRMIPLNPELVIIEDGPIVPPVEIWEDIANSMSITNKKSLTLVTKPAIDWFIRGPRHGIKDSADIKTHKIIEKIAPYYADALIHSGGEDALADVLDYLWRNRMYNSVWDNVLAQSSNDKITKWRKLLREGSGKG